MAFTSLYDEATQTRLTLMQVSGPTQQHAGIGSYGLTRASPLQMYRPWEGGPHTGGTQGPSGREETGTSALFLCKVQSESHLLSKLGSTAKAEDRTPLATAQDSGREEGRRESNLFNHPRQHLLLLCTKAHLTSHSRMSGSR